MLAKTILTTEITPLRMSDTGLTALSQMDEYKVNHLPVVTDAGLVGLLSESDIMQLQDTEEAFEKLQLAFSQVFVEEERHILDVFRIVAAHNLSLLPVVNAKNQYVGCITLQKLMQSFATIDPIKNAGGIIVLQINLRDYNLVEIAGIAEANDAKIMGLYTYSSEDSMKLEVTLKMNSLDISAILLTFSRYNYLIKASFGQSDLDNLLRDRYEALMSYLNI
jgi:acetoin utilization protein AcuB